MKKKIFFGTDGIRGKVNEIPITPEFFFKLAKSMNVFLGKKNKNDLPEIYNKADVFVFPSRTDTFGLVLLEAMACGVPVAAFPAPGPIDVIGDSKAGYLSEDLKEAVKGALKIPRNVARDRALKYSWLEATRLFLEQQVQI